MFSLPICDRLRAELDFKQERPFDTAVNIQKIFEFCLGSLLQWKIL
jgi:hypothetical protein